MQRKPTNDRRVRVPAKAVGDCPPFASPSVSNRTRRQQNGDCPPFPDGDDGQGDSDRLTARRKLSRSEKVLSGLIYERVENERGFSRIRTKGDQALFGGVATRAMKKRLGVPQGRALADFLPTITLQAKEIANQITNARVKRDYLHTEAQITREHVKNNHAVRKMLGTRRIKPEDLPVAEDVKKIKRRLAGM